VTAELVCSARGCRRSGAWALRWNNPRLHDPDRRKTWLACGEHRESLADFLTVRGFLRETLPADQLTDDASGERAHRPTDDASDDGPDDGPRATG
jgi:hypothetical protein